MEINTSVQLPLEQALKALIPYLQSLEDPEGLWDFLDVPFPSTLTDPQSAGFLFMAGHEAPKLPDDKTSFLCFIAGLPDYRAIGMRYPQVFVRMELGTAGIADEVTRTVAITQHSERSAALIRLFSPWYFKALRAVLLPPLEDPDTRPWKGLGFDAWNAQKPVEGQSVTGGDFVAVPSYIFTVHFETAPDQWPES